jgi:hypothetical protein
MAGFILTILSIASPETAIAKEIGTMGESEIIIDGGTVL